MVGEKKSAEKKIFERLIEPSNLALIGAKSQQHTFQKICNFRFFDAEKKIEKNLTPSLIYLMRSPLVPKLLFIT